MVDILYGIYIYAVYTYMCIHICVYIYIYIVYIKNVYDNNYFTLSIKPYTHNKTMSLCTCSLTMLHATGDLLWDSGDLAQNVTVSLLAMRIPMNCIQTNPSKQIDKIMHIYIIYQNLIYTVIQPQSIHMSSLFPLSTNRVCSSDCILNSKVPYSSHTAVKKCPAVLHAPKSMTLALPSAFSID